MWAYDDLPDEELAAIADTLRLPHCGCLPPEATGTRHGWVCGPHKAIAVLARRLEDQLPVRAACFP